MKLPEYVSRKIYDLLLGSAIIFQSPYFFDDNCNNEMPGRKGICPALQMIAGCENFEEILPLFANPALSRTYQHDLPYHHKLEGSRCSWGMPSAMATSETIDLGEEL